MAVTLLGADATAALLGGRGRVAVVNHTAAESDVVIVAAAIVRHRDGEDPHSDVTYALEVGAEQSVEIEAAPPLTEPPDATEVLLRLRIGDAATATMPTPAAVSNSASRTTMVCSSTARRSSRAFPNSRSTFSPRRRRHDGL
jgi:hypothetical protein